MPGTAVLRRRPSARRLLLLAAVALGAAACAPGPRMQAAPDAHAPRRLAGTAGSVTVGVPVLAWHGFEENPAPRDGSLTESFARFEETVRFLAEHGFRSVFPEEVRPGDAENARRVVLTFDDGRKEQVRAAEILERHGFRGIFFVIPSRTRPGDPRFLDPDDVARLVRAGHRVAAHGYQHRSMASSGTEVAASIARSHRMLGGQTRQASTADFAFPFGHYTAEVAEAVAGSYRYLHTVNPGYWDGASALLPRMLIMGGVDPALFREYLLGGGHYRPVLEPLTPDGAVADTVAFVARGVPVPDSIRLFAISADAEGRSYVHRPLGEHLRVRGDTVWVDLAGYMARYHGPGRGVISYALVRREGGEIRYLSPGLLNWIWDPIVPRPAPGPPRPDSGSAPRPGAPPS